MKKQSILFLLLSLAALTAACTSGTQATRENRSEITYLAPDARGQHRLTLWHSMSASSGVLFTELINEFNQGPGQDAGIFVDAIFQGSYSDSSAQLRAFLASGNVDMLPDVSQIDATGMIDILNSPHLAQAADFASLDPNFDLSRINENMLMNITYQDTLLGLPFSQSTTILFYNRDLIEERGFHGAPSNLWEMALMLSRFDQNLPGFALSPATPTVQNWIGQQNGVSFVTDNMNGRGGYPTRVVIHEEGTLEVFLEAWKTLYKTGGLRHIEVSTRDEFMSGRVAMFVESSSNIAQVVAGVDGRFRIGTAFLPMVKANAEYGSTLGGSSMFMFNKGDLGRMWAAWELMTHLVGPEVQARWAMGTGYLAANHGSFEIPEFLAFLEENQHFNVAMEQLQITDQRLLGLWVPGSFQFFMELRNGIIAMIEDDLPPYEASENIARALQVILDDFHQTR